MKGQWIGKYSGTNTGHVILNVDERSSIFEGVAYINDDNPEYPSLLVKFSTPDKSTAFSFTDLRVLPIHPVTGVDDQWDNIKHHFSDEIIAPKYVNATMKWSAIDLELSWSTDIGTNGTCTFVKSKADEPSELVPLDKVTDWESFKAYISSLEGRRYLFRGQKQPWRLRTSFHRSGRTNLHRFLNDDIQSLYKHLSARTKHVFNLNIPDENGAFFNLVQHHGYPTPLLDWTYSPYVAAFFAYREISSQPSLDTLVSPLVRIHLFDQRQWRNNIQQIQQLLYPQLHLSIGEFLAIENERMIPQQAASTVTNIDDIETYLSDFYPINYLSAIDLPVSERQKVMLDLSHMGITAGSLFPGLDGACEELKERNFRL